jgi:glycosyltransferase involved in cell wall biosynthesis
VENPIVFGGEGLFFYKMLPFLKKGTRTIELCHLDTWFPFTIGRIDFITVRAFSSISLKEKAAALIRANHLPDTYAERLVFIENKIDIPSYTETHNEKLEVVFIGRGAPQKRVPLVAAIAEKMQQDNAPVHFSFVGDVDKVIDVAKYPYCTFYGNINNDEKMKSIYRQSDVLILTSAYEGLPLVVMQMMVYGKVVLSTAINAIPDYIRHMENGLLIYATDETEIVTEGAALLQLLVKEPQLKTTLGLRSREIGQEKFNGDLFCRKYRELFFPTA